MARELTADFGANTSKFSTGVAKLKSEITNINLSIDENKKAVSAANKTLKDLEKEEQKLADEIKKTGTATKDQEEKMSELRTKIGQTKANIASLKTEQAALKIQLSAATNKLKEQATGAAESAKAVNEASAAADKLKTAWHALLAVVGTKKLYEMLIGSNAQFEQYRTSFEVMLGDADRAKKMMNDLTEMASKTPLTSNDLVSAATLLMNYGIEADNVIEKLTQLGDLSSGNAEKMNRIALAYGQMLAKGKVTGEEMRQLTEAGVPLLNALADSMGKTTAEVTDMISKSQVGIAELDKAIESLTTGGGKFAGMMSKQAETYNGLLSTLKDNFDIVMREIGEGAFEEIKGAIQEIIDLINEARNNGTLEEIAQTVGKVIAGIVSKLIELTKWLYDNKEMVLAAGVAYVTFKTAMSIGNIITATASAVKTFTTAIKGATTAQQAFNTASNAHPLVALISVLLAATSGVIAFAAAAGGARDSLKELGSNMETAASNAQSFVDEQSKLKDIISEYKEVSESSADVGEKAQQLERIQKSLSDAYGDSAKNIDLVNGKYSEQIELLSQLGEDEKARKKNQIVSDLAEAEKEIAKLPSQSFTFDFQYSESTKKDIIDKVGALIDEINGDLQFEKIIIHGGIEEHLSSGSFETLVQDMNIDEQIDFYTKLKDIILETGEANGDLSETFDSVYDRLDELKKVKSNYDALTKALNDLNNETDSSTKVSDENLTTVQKAVKSYEELIKVAEDNKKSTSNLVSEYKKLASAMEEYTRNGSLSLDTALNLIDAGYSACIAIDNETGAVRLNVEAYKELAKAKLEAQQASLELEAQELKEAKSRLESDMARYGQSGDVEKIQQGYSRINAINDRLSQIDATRGLYDQLSSDSINWGSADYKSPFSSSSSSSSSKDSYYSDAYNAYKTEADKKLELIERELKAKRKLRDETIKAIDDEIAARKRLNEDNDLEKQINEVKAKLKYSQLDEFSRGQLEKQLGKLNEEKAEKAWERSMQDKKNAANAEYDNYAASVESEKEHIKESLATVKQIMDSLAKGLAVTNNTINNYKNSTANINLASQALSMAQITKAVKDALMDDIVI